MEASGLSFIFWPNKQQLVTAQIIQMSVANTYKFMHTADVDDDDDGDGDDDE